MGMPVHLRTTSRKLGLRDWTREGRRGRGGRQYFELIDRARDLVRRWERSDEAFEPDDTQLVWFVVAIINAEGRLADHVVEHGSVIADEAAWMTICEAAAWEVMQSYRDAVERGEWPP